MSAVKSVSGAKVRAWGRSNPDKVPAGMEDVLKDGARGRLPFALIEAYHKAQRSKRAYEVGMRDERTFRVGNRHVTISEIRRVTGRKRGRLPLSIVSEYREKVGA